MEATTTTTPATPAPEAPPLTRARRVLYIIQGLRQAAAGWRTVEEHARALHVGIVVPCGERELEDTLERWAIAQGTTAEALADHIEDLANKEEPA